jgi:tetratricopeptide (TPR) repeat protein
MKASQVFVSHTADMARFPQSRSFVQAALEAVNRVGMAPVDMRYFAALDETPADYCRQRVRECEIYVAVIGFRYGSMVPGEAVSYVELEFDEASRAGLPRLVFLLEDSAELPAEMADADRAAVDAFRQRLMDAGLIVRSFTSYDRLELEVFHALRDLAGVSPVIVAALPRDIGVFTGRAHDLDLLADTVKESVRSGRVLPIHTIDGMAGVGKTAFAIHAAHRLNEFFPDGQYFLRLRAHTPDNVPADPTDALATLLLEDGVAPGRIPGDLQARADLWRTRTASKRIVLLLDDAADSEQVRPLLPAAPGSLVVITSRRRLTGLDDTLPLSLTVLPPREAAELFVRVARRPGLLPDDRNVIRLVELCGFLPLAICMVAARLPHHPAWSATDLVGELTAIGNRPAVLHDENRSVSAAFDLSYRDLTPEQQQLFRHLGARPGDETDIYAAAAMQDTSLPKARGLLQDLEDHHLIDESAHGRYQMHDLIREHAGGLAATSDPHETQVAINRLLGYYLRACQAAERHLSLHPPTSPAPSPAGAFAVPGMRSAGQAITWMEMERANLHAAVEYAGGLVQPVYALHLAALVHGFLHIRGYWLQAQALDRTALDSARLAGDVLAEADALVNLSDVQRLLGQYATSEGSARRALELYGDVGSRIGQANALTSLGQVQRLAGSRNAAEISLREAADIYASLGSRRGHANSLTGLGQLQLLAGQYAAAASNFQQALEFYRATGSRIGQATALNWLGQTQRLSGEFRAGATTLGRALRLHRDLGDRNGLANALTWLGDLQVLTGSYVAATRNLQQALELYRMLGSQLGQATALTRLGDAQMLTGQHELAAENLHEAVKLHQDLGNEMGRANALMSLGDVQRATGQYVEAGDHLHQALSLFIGIGDQGGEAEALNTLGRLTVLSSTPEAARALHGRALAIAQRISSPLDEANALEGIGESYLHEQNLSDGAGYLQQALTIYQRMGAARDAGRVTARLDALS